MILLDYQTFEACLFIYELAAKHLKCKVSGSLWNNSLGNSGTQAYWFSNEIVLSALPKTEEASASLRGTPNAFDWPAF